MIFRHQCPIHDRTNDQYIVFGAGHTYNAVRKRHGRRPDHHSLDQHLVHIDGRVRHARRSRRGGRVKQVRSFFEGWFVLGVVCVGVVCVGIVLELFVLELFVLELFVFELLVFQLFVFQLFVFQLFV